MGLQEELLVLSKLEIELFGRELHPQMHGRQTASCILELVCQPFVRVLTKDIRRCGWIFLSFNLKNSKESSLGGDGFGSLLLLFESLGPRNGSSLKSENPLQAEVGSKSPESTPDPSWDGFGSLLVFKYNIRAPGTS